MVTGTLTHVQLPLQSYDENNPSGIPLDLDLQTVGTNNLPTDTVLAPGQIAYDDPEFSNLSIHWISISMTPCSIIAGQKYAILIEARGTGRAYSWYLKGTENYYKGGCLVSDTGSGWVGSPYDLGFRAHVEVPEPAAMGLMALGTVGLTALRRRRN